MRKFGKFFFFFASKRKAGNKKGNESERSETTKRNETEPKNWENKSQKGQNLIDLQVLIHPPPPITACIAWYD
jgi:hypothetical protein